MTAVAVIVQPLKSVVVTVYVPAVNPEAVSPVPPEGAHEYVYGEVPPFAVTVAVAVEPPKHVTSVLTVVAASTGGCVIVTLVVTIQPTLSVTVTV
jgi:hypothetical protein